MDDTEYLLGPDTQDELASCREQAQDVIALPGFDELIHPEDVAEAQRLAAFRADGPELLRA